MESRSVTSSHFIGVLVADSNQMQSQLLVGALHRRPEFRVTSCLMDINEIMIAANSAEVQVAVLNLEPVVAEAEALRCSAGFPGA